MGGNGTGKQLVKFILDTSAVMAFFLAEKGGDAVKKLLVDSHGSCCIHSANWIEVYYKMHNKAGLKAAKTAIDQMSRIGVSTTDISGQDFLLRVAEIKIEHPSLSLGDCYAVALSEWLNGTVVTSDKRFMDAKAITRVKLIR